MLADVFTLGLGPLGSLGTSPTMLALYAFIAFFFATIAVILSMSEKPVPGIPIVGDVQGFDFMHQKTKNQFSKNVPQIFREGLAKYPGKPFQMMTFTGYKVILPASLVDEIRSNPKFSFIDSFAPEFCVHFPGFEPLRGGKHFEIFLDSIKVRLTGALSQITSLLCEEMEYIRKLVLPPSDEWKEISFRRPALQLAARMSSRIFLGPKLCRDPEWLEIAINYTTDAVMAARALRMWPPFLRPIVHWFLPETGKIRQEVADAHRVIEPEVIERRKIRAARAVAGKEVLKPLDTLQWLEDSARGEAVDLAVGQLSYSFVSIHTTSALITSIMYDLIAYPEYIDLLRQEIIEVLGPESDGWSKSSLQQLKMMDSVMKESQRMNHFSQIGINRLVGETTTLSDGTTLRKGTIVTTPVLEEMSNPEYYDSPEKFNGRRFYDLRQLPGNENKYQLVSTSSQHFGFGHGTHACPGRFFAANEIKIMLIFLLMKYDWKYPEGHQAPPSKIFMGTEVMFDPKATLLYKSRTSEITFPTEK